MNAKSILKSINRHIKRAHIFEGGKSFGVDFATWSVCYPQISSVFCKYAKELTGREGRYIPAALLS